MKIILVSMDTTRADRLGCYGYHQPTSPYLDKISSQGVLFKNAFASDIPTEVAHTSIFTGRVGLSTGVVAHGSDSSYLPKTYPWLPMLLREAGYTTAAVDNLYQLQEWFARGFQYYINTKGRERWIDGRIVTDHAKAWIREHRDEDFFLFIHYWDAHTPYIPPEKYVPLYYPSGRDPYDTQNRSMEDAYNHPVYPFLKKHLYDFLGSVTDVNYVNALYNAEIRYQDSLIEELDMYLEDQGIKDDTLLILFGDHGESLSEHKIYWDHWGLYDVTVHVPIIMRWPGHIPAGRRVTGLVQQVDLMPTILEAAGILIPEGLNGKSLWPSLKGESDGTQNIVFLSECSWQASRAVRTPQYKLIRVQDSVALREPRVELYDLEVDPAENHNLVNVLPHIAYDMERTLDKWIKLTLAGRVDPMEKLLNEEGLPYLRRIERVLNNVGLTWSAWRRNPSRRLFEGVCSSTLKG